MKEILKVNNLIKKFPKAGGEIDDADAISVLKGINFDVEQGEYVGIMGKSGCGKTTLLKILGFMDQQTDGDVIFDGANTNELWKEELTDIRRRKIGFVFQDFNLLDTLTIAENIALSLIINKDNINEVDNKVKSIASKLGISDILEKFPYEVSGGQKQRCACARALINKPKLILADEPTGALDSKSSRMLLETMEEMNEKLKATILMVTHDSFSASFCGRVLFLKDGKIFNEIIKGEKTRKEFFNEILDMLTLLGGDVGNVK